MIKKFPVSHNTKFTVNFRNVEICQKQTNKVVPILQFVAQYIKEENSYNFFRSTNCITTYLRSKKYVFEK